MEFHFEHKTIFYLALFFIPLVSIIMGKGKIFQRPLPFLVLSFSKAFSMFSAITLSIFLLFLPLGNNFLIQISASFFVLLVVSLWKKNYYLQSSNMEYFAEASSPAVKIIFAVVLLLFFGVVQMSALLAVSSVIIEKLFSNPSNLFLAVSLVVAGSIVLIGGVNAIVINSTFLGLLAVVLLSVFLVFPANFQYSIENIFPLEIYAFAAKYTALESVLLFSVFGIIGFLLLIWWMWWVDNGASRRQNNEEKHQRYAISFSLLFLLAGALLFYRISDAPASAPQDTSSFVMLFGLLFLFLLLGVLIRSLQLVQILSSYFLANAVVGKKITEKELLVGKLSVAAAAIINILFFPLVKTAGANLIHLNIIFASSFIVPLSAVYILFSFWHRLKRQGITAGAFGGIIFGFVNFIFVVWNQGGELPVYFHPLIFSVENFFITIALGFLSTIIVESVQERRKKNIDRIAAEVHQKI